jgi:Sel1 repeat
MTADSHVAGLTAYGKGDFQTALAVLCPLAQLGDAIALHFVGEMHLLGQGVPEDPKAAVHLLEQAARMGLARAQDRLGQLLADGHGVEKDQSKAAQLFAEAAAQDCAPAQYHLGLCFEHGRGVKRDAGEAARWYRKAAEQGELSAQCNLGAMYARGDAIPKNIVLAYVCFRLAARHGHENALKNLGAIAWRLAPEQRAEGERIIEAWKPGSVLPSTSLTATSMNETNDLDVFALFRPMRDIGRNMSLGDMSTLEATMQTPGARLMTTSDSPNGQLWSQLERLGWAMRVPTEEIAEFGPNSRVFQPTDVGIQHIPSLIKVLIGDYHDRQSKSTPPEPPKSTIFKWLSRK